MLDLSITDIEAARANISAKIADHVVVTTKLNLALPQSSAHQRKVWSYAKADWPSFKVDLEAIDWSLVFDCDATGSTALMTEGILNAASKNIPQRMACIKK